MQKEDVRNEFLTACNRYSKYIRTLSNKYFNAKSLDILLSNKLHDCEISSLNISDKKGLVLDIVLSKYDKQLYIITYRGLSRLEYPIMQNKKHRKNDDNSFGYWLYDEVVKSNQSIVHEIMFNSYKVLTIQCSNINIRKYFAP